MSHMGSVWLSGSLGYTRIPTTVRLYASSWLKRCRVCVHSDCTAIGSLRTRVLQDFKQRPVSGSMAHT